MRFFLYFIIFLTIFIISCGGEVPSNGDSPSPSTNNDPPSELLDLKIENHTKESINVKTNQTLNFTFTVSSNRDSSNSNLTLSFYKSSDASFDSSDTILYSNQHALVQGQLTKEIEFSTSNVNESSYYGACISSVMEESDLSNNCSSAILINTFNFEVTVNNLTVYDGNTFNHPISISGGTPPYSYQLEGTFPLGRIPKIDTTNHELICNWGIENCHSTPYLDEDSNDQFVLKVTDSNGLMASSSFNILTLSTYHPSMETTNSLTIQASMSEQFSVKKGQVNYIIYNLTSRNNTDVLYFQFKNKYPWMRVYGPYVNTKKDLIVTSYYLRISPNSNIDTGTYYNTLYFCQGQNFCAPRDVEVYVNDSVSSFSELPSLGTNCYQIERYTSCGDFRFMLYDYDWDILNYTNFDRPTFQAGNSYKLIVNLNLADNNHYYTSCQNLFYESIYTIWYSKASSDLQNIANDCNKTGPNDLSLTIPEDYTTDYGFLESVFRYNPNSDPSAPYPSKIYRSTFKRIIILPENNKPSNYSASSINLLKGSRPKLSWSDINADFHFVYLFNATQYDTSSFRCSHVFSGFKDYTFYKSANITGTFFIIPEEAYLEPNTNYGWCVGSVFKSGAVTFSDLNYFNLSSL